MNRKISSDITRIFQIALMVKFIILSIVVFILLFIFDLKINLILFACWLIGIFVLRQMGITKLKSVYWNDQSLIIGHVKSKHLVPLTDIKIVERTFLFDDFPYRIKYEASGQLKTLYFLPKSKFFQDFISENELIEQLKKEIKRSNTNNI
ncbi:hypothetical protein [Aquimarina spongiae]|nr:hypothetical protein [Aquimarina spongiae]